MCSNRGVSGGEKGGQLDYGSLVGNAITIKKTGAEYTDCWVLACECGNHA